MPGPGVDPGVEIPASDNRLAPLLVLVAVRFEARGLARGVLRAREAASRGEGGALGVVVHTVGLGAAGSPGSLTTRTYMAGLTPPGTGVLVVAVEGNSTL